MKKIFWIIITAACFWLVVFAICWVGKKIYLSSGGITYAGDLIKFTIAPYMAAISGAFISWHFQEKKEMTRRERRYIMKIKVQKWMNRRYKTLTKITRRQIEELVFYGYVNPITEEEKKELNIELP